MIFITIQPITPPPHSALPIIQKLIELYKVWQQYLPHFPATSRHTLGARIDILLVQIGEVFFSASFQSEKQKLVTLEKASRNLDSVKFLLRLAWEIKSFDTKRFIVISGYTDEIGKMLGGWLKQLKTLH